MSFPPVSVLVDDPLIVGERGDNALSGFPVEET
jgi:hypothetical protein